MAKMSSMSMFSVVQQMHSDLAKLLAVQQASLAMQQAGLQALLAQQAAIMAQQAQLAAINADLDKLVIALTPSKIVGITALEEDDMKATFAKTAPKKARMAKKGDTLVSFTIVDDPGKPGSYIVMGVDAAGDLLDISGVATITATDDGSGNVTTTVTGPVNFAVQGNKITPAGSPATVSLVATWNDNSVGPFPATCSFTVTAGAAAGLAVQRV